MFCHDPHLWFSFLVGLSQVHLGLSPLLGLQGWFDVLWNKVSYITPCRNTEEDRRCCLPCYFVFTSKGPQENWDSNFLCFYLMFQGWHALSNLGHHHSWQEETAQHSQWRRRGHYALTTADIAHQRTDLPTGRSCWRKWDGHNWLWWMAGYVRVALLTCECVTLKLRCISSILFAGNIGKFEF